MQRVCVWAHVFMASVGIHVPRRCIPSLYLFRDLSGPLGSPLPHLPGELSAQPRKLGNESRVIHSCFMFPKKQV